MDQRTSAIDQDLKHIVQTRIAIAEKLRLLEQRITHQAEDVTMTCSQMVNRTTTNLHQLMDKTKSAMTPSPQVAEHPWLLLGGALCAGYAIGLIERGTRHARNGVYPYYPPGARGSRVMPGPAQPKAAAGKKEGVYDYYPQNSRASHKAAGAGRGSLWESVTHEFGQETEEATRIVIQAGRSLIFELARKAMPEIARTLGVNLSTLLSDDRRAPAAPASANEAEGSGK
jgi:hypothetical protein